LEKACDRILFYRKPLQPIQLHGCSSDHNDGDGSPGVCSKYVIPKVLSVAAKPKPSDMKQVDQSRTELYLGESNVLLRPGLSFVKLFYIVAMAD
jgi:hypothetical protein